MTFATPSAETVDEHVPAARAGAWRPGRKQVKIRVVIADDRPALRAGVRAVLAEDPEIEVVGEAKNGQEAVSLVESLRPDLAILDVAMPVMTGIEAASHLSRLGSQTKFLALSMHTDASYVRGMMEAGSSGYVLKDCAAEDLIPAVHAVLGGETYFSDGVSPGT